MKKTLLPGLEHHFTYKITEKKTVPALYPEANEFLVMPEVFATGFMVGLIEWTCIQAVNPFLDWPEEQTVWDSYQRQSSRGNTSGFGGHRKSQTG